MIAPKLIVLETRTDPLADLRVQPGVRPRLLYVRAYELTIILDCTEAEAETARRWLGGDGLEIRS